jgi:hypothetical protein
VLQAIETKYRAYRFRSRLEARWAVFLDAAGIRWEYEPEGFDLKGGWYLPDFWLPRSKSFLEIKPEADSWHEASKMLSPVMRDLADASDFEVFLILSVPCPEDEYHPHVVGFAPNEGICSAPLFECRCCGQIAFRRFGGGAWNMWCECRGSRFHDDNYSPYELSRGIRCAMLKARQARFEHGEGG